MQNTTMTETLRPRVDWKNRIIWILLVTVFWYMFVFSVSGEFVFGSPASPIRGLVEKIGYMKDATYFTLEMYLSTLIAFLGAYLYTGITKRNRFIFRSFLPKSPGNTITRLLQGLLVGFVMNFGCIVCALAVGDIKLFLNFTITQIPFYLFALVCVFVQSSAEELWTRGFMYERINVHYPLWVAILVNGVFFALMHVFNPGAGFLPILDIAICGLSFSLAKWYTGSIWFPMGIHTAWNFTQNYLFGLPNSGLVSEASVFGLDAANARGSLIYDVQFGVEGALPAVFADLILGVVCLLLAAKKGRLGELMQKQVTPGKDPSGPQPIEYKIPKDGGDVEHWNYAETATDDMDAAADDQGDNQ